MFKGTLIRSGNNAKTVKGDGVYETAIMYLAPFNMAGANVCPMAEQAGCVKGCLNTAGRGAFNNVQIARINKTKRYLSNRAAFMAELVADLEAFVRYCKRKGVKPAVRLNGTSDIQFEVAHPAKREAWRIATHLFDGVAGEVLHSDKRWVYVRGQSGSFAEFPSIFEAFPEIQFYDYTKVYKRAYRDLPANYALVLSYSAAHDGYAKAVVKAAAETGANMAVVFRHKNGQPDRFTFSSDAVSLSRQVFNGDNDDLRFLDPKGVIVGLYAKGAAKQDRTGFVVG